MATTSQTAPIFHGIKLAGNSAIENMSVSVVAADPAASIGGKLWVVDAETGVSDQKLRYSYVDSGGAVQTATVASSADLSSAVSTINSTTGTLTTDLAQEVTDRQTADGSIDFSGATGNGTASDDTETATLQAATDLTGAILAENSRAVASEDDLQSQINDILSNTDPGALDSLTEVVSAFQTADSNLNQAITDLAAARESALSTAMGSIWDETTDTFTGVKGGTDLTTELAAMVTDYDAKINQVESSAGLQADGTLTFTTYDSNTMAVDFTSTTSLLAAIEAINSELKTGANDALNQEILDRQAADGDLDFSGTTLVASDLTAAIIAEYTRATGAETAINNELTTTQTGAGLGTDGSYTADVAGDYTSGATSLYNADQLLDDALKAEETARIAQDNQIEAGAGLAADGTYVVDATGDYISTATSLSNADSLLDDALKAEETARIAQDDAIEAGAGLNADGTYTADATSDYITTATSLYNADQLLDDALKAEETARISQDDTIEASVGLGTDGSHVARSGTNYIDGAATIAAEITALDGALKTEETNRIAQDDQIEASVGLNADGTYQTFVGSNYIDSSTTIRTALSLLDTALNTVATSGSSDLTNLQNEVDATQGALGTMINAATGAYVAFSGSNYMDSATSVTTAMTALDTALAAEVTARKDDDADIIAAINAGNYYEASAAATTHTITHNLASDQLIIQVLVDQGDGTYANDIVPIAIDSNNAFTVYLATSSAIRVSVLRMDDISITVN